VDPTLRWLLSCTALALGVGPGVTQAQEGGEPVSAVVVGRSPGPCAASLELAGDVESARVVVNSLPGELPAEACAGATVEVARTVDGYRVRFGRDDRSIEREVGDLAVAAIWVESWLSPPALAAATPTPTVAGARGGAEPPQATDDETPPPLPTVVTVRETDPEWHLATTLDAFVGDVGSTWLGGELALAWHVSDLVWLGGALGGAVDLGQAVDDVDRTSLRAGVRGGVRARLPFGSLRVGLGAGISEGLIRVRGGANPRTEDEGGPFAEALIDATIPLAAWVAVTTGLYGRYHQVEGGDAEDVPLPVNVPALLVGGRVGVAWTFGGAR
jgi:hypothetical protein